MEEFFCGSMSLHTGHEEEGRWCSGFVNPPHHSKSVLETEFQLDDPNAKDLLRKLTGDPNAELPKPVLMPFESETVVAVSDILSDMFQRQIDFQGSLGFHPEHMIVDEKVYYAKDQILALLDEAHEALSEIGWKPWATSRHFNRDAFVGELIDVWHFLMNLFIIAEVSPREMYEKYVAKNNKNIGRQNKGYDGVTDKCSECKRAYDDDAVKCFPPSETMLGYCADKKKMVEN